MLTPPLLKHGMNSEDTPFYIRKQDKSIYIKLGLLWKRLELDSDITFRQIVSFVLKEKGVLILGRLYIGLFKSQVVVYFGARLNRVLGGIPAK